MRRLKTGGKETRKRALFGADGAAVGPFILTAAGINVAGQAAAALVGANAAKEAAKQQADATVQAAQRNAEAIRQQNEANKALQTKSMDFTKSQNEQNRELQKDIQMNLQMLTGAESTANRKRSTKIQLRNGGKRVNDNYTYSLLPGGNMPFHITDGGGVISIGTTPEGFNLYELYGNDHEHYHKTKGGKSKSGVGIKFANGDEIEGEGNQNTNRGELLLTTPEGGYFISKHTLAGFNPANAVRQGMHPAIAFQTQETIKDMNGISDDGKHNISPVKKRRLRLAGGELENIMAQYYPQGLDLSTDTVAPTATGAVYALQNQEENSLKHKAKFGSCSRHHISRRKAYPGDYTGNPNLRYGHIIYDGPAYNQSTSIATPTTTGGFGNWVNNNAQWIGAGINALGNIGGALITNWGNNRAANVLSDAYSEAGRITADAYRNMTGIDMSNLRREDYAAAHYLPAIRSAYYNINPQLAASERSATRRRLATKRNTLSSAAMLSRLGRIDTDAADERMRLYGEQANREENIKQANNAAINEAAAKNAELDTQANQQYSQAYLNLLQYNNDINNQKIAGIAEALSSGITNSASARANARQANANAWASAISQSALGFGNTLSAMAKQKMDKENVMLGASNDAYYRNLMMNGTASEKAAARAQLKKLIDATDGETKKTYQIWYDMLG